VLAIIDAFWNISSALLSRPSLRQQLGERFGSEKEMNDGNSYNARLNNSINLALRLWLTIVIRDSVFAPAASAIEWDDHSTLQEFLKRQFPAPRPIQTPSEKDNTMILRSDFTAVNLRRIGGINIDWTCDLSEHLKFDRETRRLKIYMLKICLYDQKARLVYPEATQYVTRIELIPRSLVEPPPSPPLSSMKPFSHYNSSSRTGILKRQRFSRKLINQSTFKRIYIRIVSMCLIFTTGVIDFLRSASNINRHLQPGDRYGQIAATVCSGIRSGLLWQFSS
jgi:hypothetical protein